MSNEEITNPVQYHRVKMQSDNISWETQLLEREIEKKEQEIRKAEEKIFILRAQIKGMEEAKQQLDDRLQAYQNGLKK